MRLGAGRSGSSPLRGAEPPPSTLQAWRKRVLDVVLVVVAAVAAIMTAISVVEALSRPGRWTVVSLFAVLAAVLAALAAFRRIDGRVRAWGLLLVPYLVGLITLASYGLGGSGRIYLVTLPVVALILVSERSAIVMSALSAAFLLAFAFLAQRGVLARWLVAQRDSLLAKDWLSELSDTAMLMAILMALEIMFYRFQQGIIAKEQRAQAELLRAHEQLEEQNARLEEEIGKRTRELVQGNRILGAIYKITDAASAMPDRQAFFARVHEIVGELMYAGNLFIALYDEATGLLSFPYFVDEKDEAFPSQPLSEFHGMTGYVIRTGAPIKHGWDEFNRLVADRSAELVGSPNEDGIGAPLKAEDKIIGAIFVQSYIPGVGYTEQDDEALAAVAPHIASALVRFQALESERRRATELTIINSVQSALVADLDLQGVITLAGDTLREAFGSVSLIITLYEKDQNLLRYLYACERGERLVVPSQPLHPGGILDRLVRSPETRFIAYGGHRDRDPDVLPGTMACAAGLATTILSGDRVLGFIQLEDFEREQAFGESEQRLLSTISATLGAALENVYLTDQKNAAIEALRQSEERFRKIVDTLPQLISIWTLDMRCTYMSPAALRLTGYTAEERLVLPPEACIEPDSLATLRAALREALEQESKPGGDRRPVVTCELKEVRKDGSKATFESTYTFLRDPEGKATGILAITSDITERKRAEIELQVAKEAAEVANRSKSAFLANMSHEIRTPMNAILGFTQLMGRDPDLTELQREHLDIIGRSGEHLLALINDILEWSKIEAGRALFAPCAFDLHRLLLDMERMFRVRVEEKRLWLTFERVGDVPRWVKTDEGKLRQVLINLVGNAVKFTSEGGVGVRVGIRPGLSGREQLVIEVEDTGFGMTKEEIGRLFEAFEQASAGLKLGGTGLGLTLSRGLLQIMGGSIEVSSVPGRGSLFTCSLPIEIAAEPDVAFRPPARRVLRIGPGQPECRVLVADDRETNRILLTQMLSSVGFQTREAVDGVQAIDAFSEWRPHVILLDMSMPVMNGYDALRAIKALPGGDETVIIAVTASAFQDDRERVLAAGADAYLSKPFKEAELFETIGKLGGLRYLYADEAVPPAGETPDSWRASVAALPAELPRAARAAAESADIFELMDRIEEVRALDPDLARRLHDLAGRYDYEEIIHLLSTED